ncbi:hypothetical protein U3516DRAFT_757974 [Neocallimastix sp. 'constans']
MDSKAYPQYYPDFNVCRKFLFIRPSSKELFKLGFFEFPFMLKVSVVITNTLCLQNRFCNNTNILKNFIMKNIGNVNNKINESDNINSNSNYNNNNIMVVNSTNIRSDNNGSESSNLLFLSKIRDFFNTVISVTNSVKSVHIRGFAHATERTRNSSSESQISVCKDINKIKYFIIEVLHPINEYNEFKIVSISEDSITLLKIIDKCYINFYCKDDIYANSMYDYTDYYIEKLD